MSGPLKNIVKEVGILELTPVISSVMEAAGYDPITKELTILFHSTMCTYVAVPQFIYDGLMKAFSKGSYHQRYIKDRYHCREGY